MHRLVRLHSNACGRTERYLLARDNMDADIAGPTHQIVYDGAVKHFEPARTARLSKNDLRHVVCLRVGNNVFRDPEIAAGNCHRIAPQGLSEP